MAKQKKKRAGWLWLLFFQIAGCDLTAVNDDFERYMTDDLVNVPRTSPKSANLGGRFWAAPFIADVREAQYRPERVCRFWHAAQAAWRMECGAGPEPEADAPISEDQHWGVYLDAVDVECSPDWMDLPWREVEGIALCAELLIDADCAYKAEWLALCESGDLPLPMGPVRPI